MQLDKYTPLKGFNTNGRVVELDGVVYADYGCGLKKIGHTTDKVRELVNPERERNTTDGGSR